MRKQVLAFHFTPCRSSLRLHRMFSGRFEVSVGRFWIVAAIAMVGMLCWNWAPSASAQTAVTGSLNGVVTDSTGAVVAGATVTVVETATGDTRALTTNDRGLYTVPFLKPGAYTVSASAQGLHSNAVSVLILVSQQSVSDLTVTPKGSKETITVSANNVQLVDTQTANITTTFTTEQFEDLPVPAVTSRPLLSPRPAL